MPGHVSHDTSGRYRGTQFKNQWLFWTGICPDASLAGLLCERQFEKVFLGSGWGKHQPGNVCLCMVSKSISVRVRG